jgi:hypothetical protein
MAKLVLRNDYGTIINDRIEKGLTLFFLNEHIAKITARKMNSYPYEVYDSNGKQVGWAVPK